MIRIGVTGTDTGVGKTVVSVALVRLLRARGLRVAAMKPAETGSLPDDPASDAARLTAAAGLGDPLDLVRPVHLEEPLAPWVAAERAGGAVDVARLDGALARITSGREALVVEGAGGLLVPLTRSTSYVDLFTRWKLEVLVVAANRLGVINHARLTVAAARAGGLRVRGLVLNETGAPADLARRTNLAALTTLLAPLPVIAFPHVSGPWETDSDALLRAASALEPLVGPIARGVTP